MPEATVDDACARHKADKLTALQVRYEREADVICISKKVLICHSSPDNLNDNENTIISIPFNYYHLSDSGGITFAIFPPVRRALPEINQ